MGSGEVVGLMVGCDDTVGSPVGKGVLGNAAVGSSVGEDLLVASGTADVGSTVGNVNVGLVGRRGRAGWLARRSAVRDAYQGDTLATRRQETEKKHGARGHGTTKTAVRNPGNTSSTAANRGNSLRNMIRTCRSTAAIQALCTQAFHKARRDDEITLKYCWAQRIRVSR